jgi:hypothetical protein
MLTPMSYRVAFVTVFGGLMLPLAAQIPTACIGQLVPLKPVSVLCQEAAPVCIVDATGTRGHWVWGCPTGPTGITPTPSAGVDPGLLNSIAHPSAPQIMSPLEIAIQAERLRQLRLQNEQLAQQATNVPNSLNAEFFKRVYGCGVLDGMLKALEAAGNAEGMSITREAWKQTTCEQVRGYVGVDTSIEAAPTPPQRQPDIGAPLSNAEVVEMVKVGLKEDTIIHVVGLRPPSYSLSQADRSKLRAAGVSEAIIQAMVEKSAGH